MDEPIQVMTADKYSELDSKRKRIEILDYFFRKYNQNNKIFTYIKPKDFKKDYKLSSNQQRTLIRNFDWLWHKYIIIGNTENNKLTDSSLTTAYKIRTEDDGDEKVFKYKIPTDPIKRKHYATLLISLIHDSKDSPSQIPFFNETVEMGMGLITKISNGIFRDILLASKIYEYFHCKKGNLLSIVAELSYFEQPIWIKFKDGTEIKNGIIHSIGIYEDGAIELSINNMTIEIETIDEIVDIYVLSKNYPSSKVGLPNINKVILFDALKNQPEYDKMVEIYDEHCINRDFPNDSLEEFIKRECDPINKDCLTLIERAKRKIRLIN